MAHHLDTLRANILLRKVEKYLDPATEAEMEAKDGTYDKEMVEGVFAQFFGIFLILFFFHLFFLPLIFHNIALNFADNTMDYINNWTQHFEIFRDFSWIVLDQFPDWPTVRKSVRMVEQKGSFDMAANSSALFEQFGYVKIYCSADKLANWRSDKLPTEERWVEIFKHMDAHNVPFDAFATVIEFVLCFPGTSAPVERIFSHGKKIWKQESSGLHVATLGSMLQVKCNMDWTCIDFFKFLKKHPDLLRKISSQDKYSFKQPQTADDSPMSVQFND